MKLQDLCKTHLEALPRRSRPLDGARCHDGASVLQTRWIQWHVQCANYCSTLPEVASHSTTSSNSEGHVVCLQGIQDANSTQICVVEPYCLEEMQSAIISSFRPRTIIRPAT